MSDSLNKSFKMPSSDAKDLIEQGNSLMNDGKVNEAIPCFESALASLERMYGEDQPELAECLEYLGQAYETGARLNDALRIHNRRLRMGEKILGPYNAAIIDVLFKLININETLGRPSEALNYCQKALACAKECLPGDKALIQQLIDRYRYLNIISGGQPGPNPLIDSIGETTESVSFADSVAEGKSDYQDDVEDDAEALAMSPAGAAKAPSLRPKVSAATSKTRNVSSEELKAGLLGQRSKEVIITISGLLIMIGLVLFFFVRNSSLPVPKHVVTQKTNSAIYTRYLTADASKEIRLISPVQALLLSKDSAIEMPVSQINCDWAGLIPALWHSLQEKELWAEKKESQLKMEDNSIYYSADGSEMTIITKMRRLAGFAQAYYLRSGEYPKAVSNDMVSQFTFQNPISGQDATVQICPMVNQDSEAVDAKTSLESGSIVAGDSASAPGKITCYTVMANVTTPQGIELKGTKFFVRACDRYGRFLSSVTPGRAYILAASDGNLLTPDQYVQPKTASEKSAGLVRNRVKEKFKDKAKQQQQQQKQKQLQMQLQLQLQHQKNPKQQNQQSAEVATSPAQPQSIVQPALPVPISTEKPNKPTQLWIISNLSGPLWMVHFGLPILLLAGAILAFVRARTIAVDVRGRTLSAGSKLAANISVALLLASMIVVMLQLFVFN